MAYTEQDITNAIADAMGADHDDPRITGSDRYPVSAVDEFMWWAAGDNPETYAFLKAGNICAEDIEAAARWAQGRKLI